uniref:Sulfotransferase domain-containing protein n=1 Tax=Wuchereria bancrofti TaxID=6293 RepID=A0AAF5PJ70_WUCBA
MPETSITEITVEKTPAYFVSKTAPRRVHSLNSTIKLIVVVRNPITRAISDYTQTISKKSRNILMPSFEEMVLGNNSSNATGMKSGVNASWGAIRIGIYHRHIRRWLQHFPLHQIHFVDGERLITNPAAEIYAVERFLTVKPEITVEKTPAYFVSKTAPRRVHSLNSTIKLIVVVRNPITRAISDYTQTISKKSRNILMPSFEEMVLGNNSSNATGMKSGVNASWGAIRIGIYHRHIRRWLQHFPLHQIHFVDGERLITNPAAEIYAVERFLTVKPVVRQSNFATDPLKGFPCVLRKDDTLHCLGKTKGRAHPNIRFDVIQKLANFYRPQNEEFFKLINKRFHWHI